jgi:hypothetical protein
MTISPKPTSGSESFPDWPLSDENNGKLAGKAELKVRYENPP